MKKIPLTQGKVALVDDQDFDYLSQFKWYARKGDSGLFYASRKIRVEGKQVTVHMHRVVTQAPEGIEVDHRDGDGLHNYRSNLRLATSAQQKQNGCIRHQNKSGFKGVCRHGSNWQASINIDKRQKCLGHFPSPEIAAKAYDEAAKKHFGEFARLNFAA